MNTHVQFGHPCYVNPAGLHGMAQISSLWSSLQWAQQCCHFCWPAESWFWRFTCITCQVACLFSLKPWWAGTLCPHKIGTWCVCCSRDHEEVQLSGQGIPRQPHLMHPCSPSPPHFCFQACWPQHPRAVVSITLDNVCENLP